MTYPSILSCSEFADDALPAADAEEFKRQLESSEDCRERVGALRGETRALRGAFATAELVSTVPAFRPTHPSVAMILLWLGWAALAARAIGLAWSSLTTAAELPPWLDWLVPDAVGTGIDLALGAFTGGADLFFAAVETVGIIALAILATVWLWRFARRHASANRLVVVCASALIVTSAIPAAHAFEVRRSEDQDITISADETIDDTLIIMAQGVRVDGTVTGDLIVMGEEVSVRGSVGGVLIAMAEELDVSAEIGGSFVGLAEEVDVHDASIGANAYSAARDVTFRGATAVDQNIAVAAADVELHGEIGGDALSAAGRMTLYGSVGRDLRLIGESVEIAGGAAIGRNLIARVGAEDGFTLDPDATVGGETDVEIAPVQPSKYATLEFYMWQLVKLFAAFVTGLILFRLFPTLFDTRLGTGSQALTTVAIGAVALIATPVIAFAAFLTLIGAPLGLMAFAGWLVGLYLAGIVTAVVIGRMVPANDARTQTLTLFIGLAVLFVLINLPFVGGLLRFAAMLVGLGLVVQWLRGWWAARPA